MNLLYFALNGLLLVVFVSASPFQIAIETEQRPDICSKGSVYWCQSFANAKQCGAMRHCIQAVWEKHIYPVDNDSICKICLDMVGQARDQLRSNETQADLKAVFEGTCELIRIKKVRQECDNLADDFVPELVEALSSQMNPQVVCSVAGLCNNAAIDQQLAALGESTAVTVPVQKKLTCNQCGKVSHLITTRFQKTDRDQLLDNMLRFCGGMSSFSDGCSNIVLSYFNEIYSHLRTNLNKDSLCHMSGVCSSLYHQHEEQPEEDESEVSSLKGDDIPCDLCKQLVTHLRDVLTANTTETEFKQVLEGLCKQTKSFKAECLSIADEYYDKIYETLTKNLDPEGACFFVGVCPKGVGAALPNGPSMPLLPVKTIQTLNPPKKLLGLDEPHYSVQEIQNMQLPIDKLMLGGQQMQIQTTQGDTQFCTLCEYFLHFLQETIASPKNEENIKHAIATTCDRLPQTVAGQCQNFVNQYGDACLALLIQDIDPATLCPRLNVCERRYSNEQCPLCLFVLQEAEELIKTNRTEENIKVKLNALCTHLPPQLKGECTQFIDDNIETLIKKLAENYPPEQICIFLRLCTPKEEMLIYALGSKKSSFNMETNEIEDNTIEGVEISTPECLLCEQLIREVEKKASSDKSRAHIEEVLEHACESLPKANLRQSCAAAIKKNADYVIDAIVKEVTPKEICVVLGFCFAKEQPKPLNDPNCVLCELIVAHLEKELKNKKNIEEIEETVRHICLKLPKTVDQQCEKFVKLYGDSLIKIATKVPPKEICTEIQLCAAVEIETTKKETAVEVLECAVCHAATEALSDMIKKENSTDRIAMAEKTCNILPAKYYQKCFHFMKIYYESLYNLIQRNEDFDKICQEVGMCFKNEVSITLSSNEMSKPAKEHLLGASKCTYGPSYWCHSSENMNECNAHEFCLKKFKAVKVILT